MLFMGIPASARATAAALIPAVLVPASACRTSTKTSITDRGKKLVRITGSRASRLTLDSSYDLRSGPGRFRSSTEKEAMLYRYRTMARVTSCKCLGCTSLGPYTAAITLFPPISM